MNVIKESLLICGDDSGDKNCHHQVEALSWDWHNNSKASSKAALCPPNFGIVPAHTTVQKNTQNQMTSDDIGRQGLQFRDLPDPSQFEIDARCFSTPRTFKSLSGFADQRRDLRRNKAGGCALATRGKP